MVLNKLVIDSTNAQTELCFLGRILGADKSPYNTMRHRHPYTAVYTMLLAQYKNRKFHMAELGSADGTSSLLWSEYFTHPEATIEVFDICERVLGICREKVKDSRITFHPIDVSSPESIQSTLTPLTEKNGLYDIIIDDSSHIFEDILCIVKHTFPFLKPGGTLIIEDIYRDWPEEQFDTALEPFKQDFSEIYFVQTEHENRWSPECNNDKLLIFVKN